MHKNTAFYGVFMLFSLYDGHRKIVDGISMVKPMVMQLCKISNFFIYLFTFVFFFSLVIVKNCSSQSGSTSTAKSGISALSDDDTRAETRREFSQTRKDDIISNIKQPVIDMLLNRIELLTTDVKGVFFMYLI